MTNVERLEREIAKLSREERTALREWFRRYDAEEWDRQIEEDAHSGRLDRLAEQAVEDHKAGRTKEL